MKKALYLVVLILFSCSTEPSSELLNEEAGAESLRETVETYNQTNPFIKADYEKHEVKVGFAEDKLILVNEINGIQGNYYSVRLDPNDIEKLKDLKSGNLEIVNFMDELLIKADGKSYFFSTREKPGHDTFKDGAQVFTAIELAKVHIVDELPRTNKGKIEFDRMAPAPCRCYHISRYAYCDSGGEGASSCSIDRCSVSCREGYFACCVEEPV